VSGTRILLLAVMGIGWLVSGSYAAAQDVLPTPSAPIGEESPPDSPEGADRAPEEAEPEPEEEGPRSPFEDKIETDRDAFTPSLRTAPLGRWIMESSYSFIDNRGSPDTNSFPELLFRYGVNKHLELRLGWNYEVGGGGNVVSGSSGETSEGVDTSSLSREQKLLYGLKVQVSEQKDWLPDSIAIVQGYTPTGGDATTTEVLATYAFGWRLPNRWRWDSSLRFVTDSDSSGRYEVWAPSSVLRVPLGERFQVHSEFFGLFSEDRASNFSYLYFSPGFHYLVTPNLELGVRVGWGLNDQTARFFSNVGFGFRF
jgi:hypothetical protein